MAYENDSAGSGAVTSLEKAPEGAPAEKGGMEGKTMHVEKDMLPDGMKVNAGDILEFKVVKPEEDGLIEVTYNMGKGTGDTGRNEAEEMTSDFKEYMSARNGEGQEPGMS